MSKHNKGKVSLPFTCVKEGEWVQPIRQGYLMQCCDCRLIHRLNFRLIRYAKGTRGKIQFQAFREDNIETTDEEVIR